MSNTITMKTTIDKLLNGKFSFEQPARGHGYRVAVDTLLLASFVKAKNDQKILELGCGVGVAMFSLATREKEINITGLELQKEIYELCKKNIGLNNFQNRIKVINGDVGFLPDEFVHKFDHVMMNPPFHEEKSHINSPNKSKTISHIENEETNLSTWIESAYKSLKNNGIMTIIHKKDRQDEIIEYSQNLFGKIIIKPIISKENKEAKRIIIRAIKTENTNENIDFLNPFILYDNDGKYSVLAEKILRNGEKMPD